MVPATRASSTMERRLSVSASSSIGSMNAIMPSTTRCASERLLRLKEFAQAGPGSGFFGEGPGVRGARGGKIDVLDPGQRLADQAAPDARRGRAVECDSSDVRKVAEQVLDLVMLGEANGLVEASASHGGRDHVPQADASLSQPLEPLFIRQRLQLFADRQTEQPPKLVCRVRIITLSRERCVAGKTPEYE